MRRDTACKFSEQATDDLYFIYESGKREFGARLAEHYYWMIMDTAKEAAQFPKAAPLREESRIPVRVRYVGSHLIVYQIEGPDIVVRRVLHQHQDWPKYI